MKKIFLLISLVLFLKLSVAQTSYVWNGTTSTAWNVSTNWTPSGIPGSADNVTIVTGSNNCNLAANTTITNLTITSGLLNLNGLTLTTTGVVACNSGTCSNGTFNSTASSLTFAGTTFGANITANVTEVYFNGSIFNGNVTVNKSGTANAQSSGNNTFNGLTSITNSGTGYLMLTNGGVGRVDNFNGVTTLNTTNTGNLYLGYGRNLNINANFIINNTAGTGSTFLGNNGSVNLNTGITITCGTFFGGGLNINKLVQSGTTALNLLPGSAGGVYITGSTFNGSLTVSAGIITAQTSTFSAAVNYSVSGTITNNWSSGGNIYNGILTVNNSSNGYVGFGNGTPDIYNADVYANNTSTTGGRIIFGNSSNNQFNGNIYVSQNGPNTAAGGIALGWGGTFPVITLATGKNILVNGTFSSGYLQLFRMKTSASTAINLTTTGTSNVVLNNNVFDGSVSVTAPDLYPYGGTYNAPVSFIKTGGTTGNHNSGNLNIFNSTLNIENQSNTGYFMLGYQSADQFNDNITVSSTGTGGISFGWSSGTGTPVLASGKTISIGAGGYTGGYLQFGSFTQLGTSTPVNLTLTGTASFAVYKNTISTVFNSSLNVTAPDIYVQGGTFNNSVVFTKTGGTSNHNSGVQNIFNSTLTLNQQSNTGYFMLGYNSNDLFNDDITVTSTGTGGISLGWSGGTGTPVLAAGKTINIGPAGFSAGYLQLGTFTQLGNAPINLAMTGNTSFNVLNTAGPCVFGGSLNVTAADLYIRGGIFNGATVFTKTAGNDNHNNGFLNIFNSTLTINQQSTSGYIAFSYNSNEIYNEDITVTNTGTRGLYLGFSSGTGTPTLAAGKTVVVGGTGFTGGFLYFGAFTQLGSTAMNLPLGNASALYFKSSTIGGNVTSTSGSYSINGSTFNNGFSAVKAGSSNDQCAGNTFNGTTSITNNGSGYFGFGWSTPDIWNGDVTFTNNGSERILPAWVANGNLFNGNITLNSTGSSTGIHFCGNGATSTATLAAGKTINTGTYDKGYLILQRFTQLGNAPVNLTLAAGASYLTISPLCTIGGNLTATADRVENISTSTFNGTANITKNGNNADSWSGGNTFNSTTTITNNGNSYLLLGNGLPDTFNGDVTFTNNGSDRILPSYNSTGNLYNGNITVNSTGSSTGIHFDAGAIATSTLAATKTIQIGGSGFTSGYLILPRFTQLGSAPISLTLPLGSNYLTIGPNSTIGGSLTVVAQRIDNIYNSTFNSSVDITKNGPGNDGWNGGNTFNSTTTLTSNSSGYFLFGNGAPDVFNGDLTLTNNGTERILPAYNSIGNMFNGNIYVNTTGSGQGIQFCAGSATATSTLAATKTIAAGSLGLNAGYLILRQFTQLGNAPITLTLSSTASYLQFGPLSNLGGNVTSVSPRVYFNGCYFNGTTNCTKNGAVDDDSNGANTFVGASTITNTGSGRILLGNNSIDAFMTTATFNNLGSANMFLAQNSLNNTFGGVTTFNNSPTNTAATIYVSGYSTGTVFSDNIIVTNVNGNGVHFCYGNATATSTLAAGKTISIGAAGFNSGTLLLKQFTQLGPTPQSFTTTGTSSIIQYGPLSSFGGNVTSASPRLYFNGCTFNGTTNCIKNGAGDDDSNGSNTFVGASTITNYGSGRIILGNASTDAFMSTANFNNLGSNHMYLAHNSTNNIFGGVTTFSNAPTGNFGIYVSAYSTGTVFNDNIIVSNVNGNGVQFNALSAAATTTLAAGKTITIGPAGFNTGTLLLKQFTQLSSTAQTLSITTGNALLQLGPVSRFEGNVNFNFPQILLHGGIYSGVANITKNGATDNSGNGGNTFNGVTNLTNSGSGHLMTGNTTSDVFNGVTTMNNVGSNRIYFAHNHTGQTTTFTQPLTLNGAKTGGTDQWTYLIAEGNNLGVTFNDVTINISGTLQSNLRILQGSTTTATYNGNLTVNLTNTNASGTQIQLGNVGNSTYNGNIVLNSTTGVTGSGVYFNAGATASSTLASTKSIGLGGSGFTSGTLSMIRFAQLGTANQTIVQTTGNAVLISGPTNLFNGPVNFNFPQVYLQGGIYNNTAAIEKNGATDNACAGGNTFNGTTTLTNSHATNYFRLANTTADTYNADVTMVQSSAGVLAPNYNTNCNYAGNITVTSPAAMAITFGSNTSGIATLSGGNAQTINKTGSSAIPVFTRLVVNKSANDATLNTKIFVSSALTLTQGLVNTTQTNILHMTNAATTGVGNSASYINGPMNYDMAVNGARTLNFPIGKVADWRPAVLSVTHNNATSYTYNSEVTNADAQALGYTKPPTVNVISQVHYWDIIRSNTSTSVVTPTLHLNSTTNPIITLYYGANDYVTDPSNLTICKNTYTAPGAWIDIGGTGATMTAGSVSSTSSAFNSFSRFTLGNKVLGVNPLPVELLYFDALPNNKTVSLDWATASEVNNDHYEIERSVDGVNFEFMANVKAYGDGNSLTKQTYNIIDENPYKGVSYYRLKQVDKNTEFKYANIVSVEFNSKSFISFFPNPSPGIIYIKASEDYNGANIKIINAAGVEVKSQNLLDSYNGQIDLSGLANGVYFIVVENGTASQNVKFSIQQ